MIRKAQPTVLFYLSICFGLLILEGFVDASGMDPLAASDEKQGNSKVNGRAFLWVEPADLERRDLFYGPGGRDGAPNLSDKFTFVRRSSSGTSEKIIVKDNRGRNWVVKFGPEAKPETTSTRLVWAAGYHSDQTYFVKQVRIEGRGGFTAENVRFERRDDGLEEVGLWKWDSNPFNGTRELQGLKVLMAIINNWDLKDDNNKILAPSGKGKSGEPLRIHYVSDLGGTLGSTGSFFTKLPLLGNAAAGTKGDPEAYAGQAFIDGVRNGEVVFHYKGKNPDALDGVTVENARWMGNLLARLSDKQIGDAFRAGGFDESEVAVYTRALRGRIKQLQVLK